MSGTKAGAAKAAKTNKDKHGPDFYAKIGAKSWSNPDRSRETGFAKLPRDVVVELGRKGGQQNKGKTYAKKQKVEEYETAESLKEIFQSEKDQASVRTSTGE